MQSSGNAVVEIVMFDCISAVPLVRIIRQRLREQLDACNARAGRRYRLSFSVGVVAGGGDKRVTLEELLTEADGLMYRQKAKKKATA